MKTMHEGWLAMNDIGNLALHDEEPTGKANDNRFEWWVSKGEKKPLIIADEWIDAYELVGDEGLVDSLLDKPRKCKITIEIEDK